MLEESKDKVIKKNCLQSDNLLMTPFALGWTREVVMRVITKNRNPSCDIYYYTPSGKKIRSLTEIKSNLSDGLTVKNFSFKREPLGISAAFETVRKARIRKKADEKFCEKVSPTRNSKNIIKSDNFEEYNSNSIEGKNNGNQLEEDLIQVKHDIEEKVNKSDSKNKDNDHLKKLKTENVTKPENSKNFITYITESKRKRLRNEVQDTVRIKTESEKFEDDERKNEEGTKKRKRVTNKTKKIRIEETEPKNFNSKKKAKTKPTLLRKKQQNIKSQSVGRGRKDILKKVISAKQAKQAKIVPENNIIKKIVKIKVTESCKKLTKNNVGKETARKYKNSKKKSSSLIRKSSKESQTVEESDVTKDETNSCEINTNSALRDIKSIVQKNIGKFREMRKNQKLGDIKNQMKKLKSKSLLRTGRRMRSEPISKNKKFYLKPLEKGWRRELVYRTNSARGGQQADVYYLHPSGKKLRSSREVAENLTPGLSIECFTFRKEPLGCGEPSEIIRNARTHSKTP